MEGARIDTALLRRMVTEQGPSLFDLVQDQPVLLVFLRNFGCTFCRQALKDIATVKSKIEKRGVQVVFIHLSSEEVAGTYFEKQNLQHCFRISDTEAQFYKEFGLTKGTFKQLFGLQNWIRGFQASMVEGHGLTPPIGDGLQMPGVFILDGDTVAERFLHNMASDRPDYLGLVEKFNSKKQRAV